MGTIKFSVLIPSRNRLDMLKDAIETVRRQKYDNWEIIVSNNCSDEDYESYIKSLDDRRVQYSRTKDFLSVTKNWNRCLDIATGDYIIMLGDDDGLVPHYMERMSELVFAFEKPDFLYTGAWHYIYPDALRARPESRLIDLTRNNPWFAEFDRPALLSRDKADCAARCALGMKSVYGYNMQYFLFSASFIEKLKAYGPVFQGPFPDFYAAQMAMILSQRTIIVPEPLVFIGISPKSYGFYFYNRQEERGVSFLNSLSEIKDVPKTVIDALLPGPNINTSWLLSVAVVQKKLGESHPDLVLGIRRYRLLQIREALRCDFEVRTKIQTQALWSRLHLYEKIIVAALRPVLSTVRILPPCLADWLLRRLKIVPAGKKYDNDQADGRYNSLLAAFDALA